MSAQYINMDEVQPEPANWLWKNQIEYGELTMLAGAPDAGKSLITCYLMAKVTRGAAMYDCTDMPQGDQGVTSNNNVPTWDLWASRNRQKISLPRKRNPPKGEGVLLYASEDRLAKIHGRLIAAGAATPLVRAMKNDTSDRIRIPSDIEQIEQEMTDFRARLLIIDPILSFLEGDPNSYKAVKKAMDPLAAMARRTGAAVVMIHHLNKSGRGPALYRTAGSVALIGSVRSAFLAAQLPRTDQCVLAPIRNKERAKSLEYRIVGKGDHAAVEWVGGSAMTADELANGPNGGPALEEAKFVLFVVLADGKVPSKIAEKAAKDAGVSARTLRRAREAMGVVSKHDNTFGPGSQWYWELDESKPEVIQFRKDALDDLCDQLVSD